MKIYIPYEIYNVEFFGKLLLALDLIEEVDEIKEIKVGFYRPILQELLSKKKRENEKVILIYGNIWKQSEILIDIFCTKGIHYMSFNEEEHIMYFIKNLKNFFKNSIIKKNYFNKLSKYLTLSKKTKDLFIKYNFPKDKIIVTGNSKLNFLNFTKKSEYYSKKKNKKILLILNDAYFRNKKEFELHKNKIKYYDFKDYKNENSKSMSFDDAVLHLYTKNQISLYLKIIQEFKKENFVLRPHPYDQAHIKKFKEIFKPYKNVEVKIDQNVNYWISNCNFVISGPGSVVIESLYLQKNCFLYFDNNNDMHQALYGNHLALKIIKENIFLNFDDFKKKFEKKKIDKKIKNKSLQTLENYFPKKTQNQILIDHLNEIKNFSEKKNNNLIFDFFINKVVKEMNFAVYGKKHTIDDYLRFKKKFKFSISRIYFIIKFFKNTYKYDFINLIYKYCLGRNFDDEGDYDKIKSTDFKKFIKFYKSKKINSKIKFTLQVQNKVVLIKNEK